MLGYTMKFVSLLVLLFFFSLSCKKNKRDLISSQKAITAFVLNASLNPGLTTDIKGDINGDTIKLAVPSTITLTALKPSITHTGQSISPGNEIAQNFSNPVEYTVTAADRSTRKYIVKVRFISTSKEILSFSFNASDNAGVLTDNAAGVINGDTIKITVDAFSTANLVPSIAHNGKQISPGSGQSNFFASGPVVYTVTAEDGTTKNYTIVVSTTASLFVGGLDAYLYAFDPGTGRLRWKYPLVAPVHVNPTYADGTVFIGNDSYLYALNSATGELKWKTHLSGGVSTSPQVVGNLVYIAGSRTNLLEGYMIAIDATTGSIKWKAPIVTEFIFCTPTVADGRVVTASWYGGLRCYDALNGDLLWTFPTTGIIRDNPSIVNGTLYIGSESYRLVAIDMVTGQQKWAIPSYDNNNNFLHGVGNSPTVHNGVLYTGGTLRAYDPATGSLKWEYSLVNSGVLRPVGENGTIFGTSPGDVVFAINSDGSVKWTYGTVGRIQPAVETASATVAHGVVFTGCGMNNKLIALNAANGQLIWSYEGTHPFISGPCVVDGKNNTFHANTSGAQQ